MFPRTLTLLALTLVPLLSASSAPTSTQKSPAELMRRDFGTWDVAITMFTPTGEPVLSKGTETNVMLGEHWLIGSFEGELQGKRFRGSRRTGFDPETQEFELSWVDSLSPYATTTRGKYDEGTDTLETKGTGKTPFGAELETRMVTVHAEDGSRTTTMYVAMNGDEAKMLEFRYTRAADAPATSGEPGGDATGGR